MRIFDEWILRGYLINRYFREILLVEYSRDILQLGIIRIFGNWIL